MKFKILDCTIRDGGYINDWAFDINFAKALYQAVSEAGVSYIELGFLNPKYEGDNLWLNCTKSTINKVIGSNKKAKVALLINYGSIAYDEILPPAVTGADMLRVVTPLSKSKEAIAFANKVTTLGYEVTINFMAVSNYENKDILELSNLINQYKDLTYYYLADSFGSLIPSRTRAVIQALKFSTDAKIGFHPHNNLQLAFANVLEAIDQGCDIVDGSILGMGRGGGNLYLETALAYFEKLNPDQFQLEPVLRFADIYMEPLKKNFQWGYSLPQLLSGVLSCHPNYPTNLLKQKTYPADDVYNILALMEAGAKNRYNKDKLEELVIKSVRAKTVVSKVSDTLHQLKAKSCKRALLLMAGPSIAEYQTAINRFIQEQELTVISVNRENSLIPSDGVFFGNRRRAIRYVDDVSEEKEFIFSSSIDKTTISNFPQNDKVSTVTFGEFYEDKAAELPTKSFSNSGVEAIAGLFEIGFIEVLVVGMDGYATDTNKTHYYQEEDANKELKYLKSFNSNTKEELQILADFYVAMGQNFKIITPTLFSNHYAALLQ
ncbi:MAG: aldolase catalytic domain-containing protein [Bacteroidota bacterium]